jgi:hypothetical protein
VNWPKKFEVIRWANVTAYWIIFVNFFSYSDVSMSQWRVIRRLELRNIVLICLMLLSSVDLVNKANLVHNFSWYVYFFSLHVSDDYVPIISRKNCIQLFHSTPHTRQSSIQNNKYQVSHKYSCFSWWWAHSRPKHVDKEINILRKIVHQVGFIYKIIQGCTVNRTQKVKYYFGYNKSFMNDTHFESHWTSRYAW